MTDDLVAFYLARLDEDEQAARAAYYEGQRWITEEEGVYRWPDDEAVYAADRKRDAAHIVRHDPARVLADVAVKRRIVAEFERCEAWLRMMTLVEPARSEATAKRDVLLLVLRLLGLEHADHPDYRAEWAP